MTTDAVQRGILLLDNGGDSIKAMYIAATAPPPPPRWLTLPNCVGAASYAGRGILGEQIHMLPHYHGFLVRRPVARGVVVDGLLQAHIWEHILQHFGIDAEQNVELWLTVPHGAPRAVASLLSVLVTQRFRFYSLTCVSSSFLSLLVYEHSMQYTTPTARPAAAAAEATLSSSTSSAACATRPRARCGGCALVVDAGFSSTTVVPYVDYLPVYNSIVRTDIGGKVLSNRLKEHLSYTQVNLMEDGWLVNYIKEQCCAVALAPRMLLARHIDAVHVLATGQETAAAATTKRRATRAVDAAQADVADANDDDDDDNVDEHTRHGGGRCHTAQRTMRHKHAAEAVLFYLPTVPALYPLGCVGQRNAARRLGLCSGDHAAKSDDEDDEDDGDDEDEEDAVHSMAQGRCPHDTSCGSDDSTSDHDDKDDGDADSDVKVNSKGGSSSRSSNRTTHSRARKTRMTTRRTAQRALTASARATMARMQAVRLAHERYLLPELLFTPGDLGSRQLGLVEALTRGVFDRGLLRDVPLLRQALLARVFVYGGSCNFAHFITRLRQEVQANMRQVDTAAVLCMPHPDETMRALRTCSGIARQTAEQAMSTNRSNSNSSRKQAVGEAALVYAQSADAQRKRPRAAAHNDRHKTVTDIDAGEQMHEATLRQTHTHARSTPPGVMSCAQMLPLCGAELLLTHSDWRDMRARVRQRSTVVFRYTRVARPYNEDIQRILATML